MTPEQRKALEQFERQQQAQKEVERKSNATKHPLPRGPIPGEQKSRRQTGDHGKDD